MSKFFVTKDMQQIALGIEINTELEMIRILFGPFKICWFWRK